ncbi:cilia- and flagella-associated protein 45 isoform X2 [Herpailurus yagouaroundi]|uniref:cilia- and flagella-associated protein 45 isoform X2 n=1 Tax=Herpailurus yagouaroundi TaxID=1608482 RepID=UPI001AD6494C|nr:cilia- and flagella-associated protein 45 isoform X2 [Puma yagouaroundi]
MPLSAAGILSSSSNRSRNKTRYRTKAVSSEVDESLFGGVKPLTQDNSPTVLLRDKHAIRKTLAALSLDHKPETIQVVTRDMVRKLIVPAKDPSGESLIMSPEDFERIRWASHVLSREELEAREQAFQKEKEAIMDAVATRKKIMKHKEMVWRTNRKLSDLEEAAKERAQDLLQRASQLQAEQEEELRGMSKDMERRHQEKLKMQAEIKRINDENQRQKAELLAQEKLADQMVMEFTKKKMAREAEFEAEQERIRREKEKEITRLRAMQEKAQDHQAQQDALRAKRNQEVADREWRRKEKENAQKKMETEAKLRQSRLEQVAFKEHALAVQVQRDRDDFERILRAQREQIEKERLEAEKKAAGRLRHADELRRQVRENQQKQVQDRIATFEEGRRLQEEAQKRRERIDDLKKKKIQELRATGLPEKYCVEAERKANILPAASVN